MTNRQVCNPRQWPPGPTLKDLTREMTADDIALGVTERDALAAALAAQKEDDAQENYPQMMPAELSQFLSDVMTAAGLVSHGKQCKALGERLGDACMRLRLHYPEPFAALEAAREDACVALVADIRFACGDNGKRMQSELVEYIRGLARDAARYRWLRDANINTLPYDNHGMGPEFPYDDDLDATIDAALAQGQGGSDAPEA